LHYIGMKVAEKQALAVRWPTCGANGRVAGTHFACPDFCDAFAADYQEDEYVLLGMAIKYAGLRGKEVRVIGRNRSSLGEPEEDTIQ
jgi:hypothetical protein